MPFATFSDKITVFDNEEPFDIVSTIEVFDKPSTHGNITWSGDAVWLAATPSTERLSIYKLEGKRLVNYKFVNVKNVKSASFFNWTNRDLIIGLENGEICIWNIKEKRVTGNVNVDLKQSVDFITCNLDDTCIASGSMTGHKIGLHSLSTNKFLRTLQLPEGELTSCLRFCQCKKGYLAASTSSSTVCVWDVIKSEAVFKSRNAHVGACSGLEFSPVNFSVLISVSLSQQLKLHDLRVSDRIFDVQLNEPLHCVDLFQYGEKVAVGTSSGSVLIYDLRINKVCNTIKADNSAINAISINKLNQLRQFHNAEIDSPDTPMPANRTLDLSVMDVFSPIVRDCSRGNSMNSPAPLYTSSLRFSTGLCPPQNDSFLSKMLSPKEPRTLMSTPLVDTPTSSNKSARQSLSGVNKGGSGDESSQTSEKETDLNLDLLKNEISKLQNEMDQGFKTLSNQLSTLEDIFIKKLQNDQDTLLEILLTIIRRDIEKCFFDMRYELITQRVLYDERFNGIMDKTDAITIMLEQLIHHMIDIKNSLNRL